MQGVIKELKGMSGWQFFAALILLPVVAECVSEVLLATFHGHAPEAQPAAPQPVAKVEPEGKKKAS